MIRNESRDQVVAVQPRRATTLSWRMRGMIGRQFTDFDALVFPRCGSIHTWFMTMPIDVVFLDRGQVVCGVRRALGPWRMAAARRAHSVVELPSGTLERVVCEEGDQLVFEE